MDPSDKSRCQICKTNFVKEQDGRYCVEDTILNCDERKGGSCIKCKETNDNNQKVVMKIVDGKTQCPVAESSFTNCE